MPTNTNNFKMFFAPSGSEVFYESQILCNLVIDFIKKPDQPLHSTEYQANTSTAMARILIVDDDTNFSVILKSFLIKKGYSTDSTHTYRDALQLFASKSYDVILTDFRLPDKNGMALLKDIRKKKPEAVVIIMTAFSDIRMAVKAIKLGAYEYVTKPVNPDEILMYVHKGIHNTRQNLQSQVATLPKGENTLNYVYASSEESLTIHNHISLVAPTNMSVVIQGESGTGKEYIARKIHEQSKRSQFPFVAIDCGSLSRELAGSEFFGHLKGSFTGALNDKTGQFEAANKGTLFLDEIGNLSYEVQVKLLRAIQERKIRKIGSNKDIPVDVRLITATNEDLRQAQQEGNFREDLYHRINEFSIRVPPLRERKEDIMVFSRFFLQQANKELERNAEIIPDNVVQSFMNYSWPGNIREVKNVIKRAVLLSKGKSINLASLPREIIFSLEERQSSTHNNANPDLKTYTGETEKEVIITTLRQAGFNKSKAAKLLRIDRKTLYNKIKLYGISSN